MIKIILIIAAIIAASAALYLLFVGLVPGFAVRAQTLKRPAGFREADDGPSYGQKKDVGFKVKGVRIDAWFFPAENASGPTPCIVMAHGLGGTKKCGLDRYAAEFQKAGFAVLAFDYRYFGGSGGEPRQLIRIPDQLEDWAAAVEYARGLKEVDPARIALWGSSLSGGHVISIAAGDPGIACLAAQCPGVDGEASGLAAFKRMGLKQMLRLVVHGQRDLVRSWLGLSPHKIPLIGEPGTVACINAQDAHDKFGLIAPPGFINEACARIAIRGDKYSPVKYAAKVGCPALLQICDRDELVPRQAVEKTADKLAGPVTVRHYDIGHFDIYLGVNFDKAVADQIEFFKEVLVS